MNELHVAVGNGSVERTIAVLSRGVVDIDQGSEKGQTPLMMAAMRGFSRVVGILLNKGASTSLVDHSGFTALHRSTGSGHLAVTKLLLKAGADLETKISRSGFTALHVAANVGQTEIMEYLIEAGANPNSHAGYGMTPLYSAVLGRHADAVRVLLRAKADPLLFTYSGPSGLMIVPLDIAALQGHLEVARELIQGCGIEGCGGPSSGVNALEMAARNQHVEIMGVLTGAGVVDTGIALRTAAASARESSMKFLVQQLEWKANGEGSDYLDNPNSVGSTPLLCSILACHACSPRIARLLVDAGADTTTAVQLKHENGVVFFDDLPLAFTNHIISEKNIQGKEATQEQLHTVEGTRRLLMRVKAVHAVSWLWAGDGTSSFPPAATRGTGKTKATPTPLTSMLPILRRRVQRRRMLLAALFRQSGKPY